MKLKVESKRVTIYLSIVFKKQGSKPLAERKRMARSLWMWTKCLVLAIEWGEGQELVLTKRICEWHRETQNHDPAKMHTSPS